ncbi:hypothetical protein [Robertmurraya andreesenii]|uniref:PilZ domain-containing protein n=1 Tax=Anoxybacillus andreesenii TaxID=1325932 RepID=A0ABT9V4E9_9BACL|nr:hypothetical protein [Robertmurraya andreesenii]MDQ0155823.1 hypothetical protein [Robertmurraya andreesenii]
MYYRRDEAFRFIFGQPIKATFKIVKVDGRDGSANEASALILDLSPNGIKFSSELDLPIYEKQLILEIYFSLNEKMISMLAEPKWKKRMSPSSFTYGLVGLDNEETKKEVIEELKEYVRKNKTSNNN